MKSSLFANGLTLSLDTLKNQLVPTFYSLHPPLLLSLYWPRCSVNVTVLFMELTVAIGSVDTFS